MSKMKLIMENWKRFIKEEEPLLKSLTPRADAPTSYPDEFEVSLCLNH